LLLCVLDQTLCLAPRAFPCSASSLKSLAQRNFQRGDLTPASFLSCELFLDLCRLGLRVSFRCLFLISAKASLETLSSHLLRLPLLQNHLESKHFKKQCPILNFKNPHKLPRLYRSLKAAFCTLQKQLQRSISNEVGNTRTFTTTYVAHVNRRRALRLQIHRARVNSLGDLRKVESASLDSGPRHARVLTQA